LVGRWANHLVEQLVVGSVDYLDDLLAVDLELKLVLQKVVHWECQSAGCWEDQWERTRAVELDELMGGKSVDRMVEQLVELLAQKMVY
jgi:hypothetical protein